MDVYLALVQNPELGRYLFPDPAQRNLNVKRDANINNTRRTKLNKLKFLQSSPAEDSFEHRFHLTLCQPIVSKNGKGTHSSE